MKNKNIVLTAVIAVIAAILAIAGINLFPENDDDKISSRTETSSSYASETTEGAASSEADSTEQKTTYAHTKESTEPTEIQTEETTSYDSSYVEYHFRNEKLLNQHFEKHGGEFSDDFGYETAYEYEKGANDVINNPDALYKTEAEDGDGIYYLESTNEFVVLSTDGYIRTYFLPSGGIDYFNRQ